jgi:hypothetical protein
VELRLRKHKAAQCKWQRLHMETSTNKVGENFIQLDVLFILNLFDQPHGLVVSFSGY